MNKITDSHLAEYETLGYTVVRGLLDMDRHIRPLFEEYAEVLDRLVDGLVEQGRLTLRYEGLPFETRLMRVYAESGAAHSQYFDFSLPQKEIAADTPGWYGPAVFHTLRADELLDAVERFIGPEIYAAPVQHIRIKPPERILSDDTVDSRVVHTPLHQDNGVLLPTADETNMLTVWFPLTEASEEMGCLMVRPGSHKAGLSPHCPGWNGLGIPERHRPGGDAVPLPMSPGDVLFMHRLTCHGSLPNNSDRVRISFDLRYNPVGESTGREVFPGFVARSRSNPSSELRDPERWRQLWLDARVRLAMQGHGPFNRWSAEDLACA
jgi:hypothetical protein